MMKPTILIKTRLICVILIFTNIVKADLIFKDGFDFTESQINCPIAISMTETTNTLGGIFFLDQESIDPIGNKDYFSYPILDNEWVQIGTDANPNGLPDLIDTVISVYNSDGSTLLAQSDDATPRISPDSNLVYHAANSENLCIKVEDFSTFSNSNPEGGPTFIYNVFVLPIDFNLYDEYNLDSEPNDTPGTAQTNLSTIQLFNFEEFTLIAGEFSGMSDTDNFQLQTPEETVAIRVTTTPSGNTGYGGSTDIGNLDIISSNGVDVLARINPSLGVSEIYLHAQASSNYIIQPSLPLIPLNDNPFYVVSWSTASFQNQQESNDVSNNISSGAEIASEVPNGSFTSHFIGGTLSGISDVDWWSFEVNAGDTINLFCSSWFVGSGVRNAAFSIFENPAMPELQTEVETETNGINWSNSPQSTNPEIVASTTSTHYLSVDASVFSETVIGRQYLCGIHIIHP